MTGPTKIRSSMYATKCWVCGKEGGKNQGGLIAVNLTYCDLFKGKLGPPQQIFKRVCRTCLASD